MITTKINSGKHDCTSVHSFLKLACFRLLERCAKESARGRKRGGMGNALPHFPLVFVPSPISYPESSGFLVSEATPGRLWGHRILLPQDFCGKTMETVTEQPIKKIEFFRCPQSLPRVAPLTKKPEDSGYEIVPFAHLSRSLEQAILKRENRVDEC